MPGKTEKVRTVAGFTGGLGKGWGIRPRGKNRKDRPASAAWQSRLPCEPLKMPPNWGRKKAMVLLGGARRTEEKVFRRKKFFTPVEVTGVWFQGKKGGWMGAGKQTSKKKREDLNVRKKGGGGRGNGKKKASSPWGVHSAG